MCKLGCGPNKEADEKSAYDNASWGVGPNKEKLDSQFLQTMKLGWDDEINFEKISYLSHSRLSRRNIFSKRFKSLSCPIIIKISPISKLIFGFGEMMNSLPRLIAIILIPYCALISKSMIDCPAIFSVAFNSTIECSSANSR